MGVVSIAKVDWRFTRPSYLRARTSECATHFVTGRFQPAARLKTPRMLA